MTHESCRALLIDLAYGELGRSAAAGVEDHLAACPECRAEWDRLGATRRTMQALEPAQPDAAGERILLAAARQAAEARAAARREGFLPGWAWKLSATAAAVLIVGGISYRILWPRQGSFLEPEPASAARESAGALPLAVAPAPSAPAPQPAPLAEAAPRPSAKATAATGGAQAVAKPVRETSIAQHNAKKMAAPASSKPAADVVLPKAAEAAPPPPPEEKLALAERHQPGVGAAPAAPAFAAPSPPPPASPPPLMDAAPEQPAVRSSPERLAVNGKRAPAAGAKDARKADAVEAEEGSLNAVAGSVASSASVAASEEDGSPARPDRAHAERHRVAAPEPRSREQEIDALARAVERRRRASELASSVKSPCRGAGEVERRVDRDADGRIVAYMSRRITGDRQVTAEHYYDETGHLRLAQITRTHSGQRTVERIYLDATGERRLSGDPAPGGLVRDPEAAFRSAAPCGNQPE